MTTCNTVTNTQRGYTGYIPYFILEKGDKMIDFMAVCRACKRVRREKHLTQKQVAEKIGYGEKTISAFENGKVNNAYVLLWYLDNGLIKYIKEGDIHGKTT